MDQCKFTMAAMLGQWSQLKEHIIEATKDNNNNTNNENEEKKGKNNKLNEGDPQSALRLACRVNIDIVKFFFERGADLNYEDPAETSTPLLSACYAGKLDIASFLIQNGALVNHRDSLGNVPLVKQVEGPNPNTQLITFLLSQKADPNVLNESGRPVIVSAKLRGLSPIVDILKEYKAVDEEPTEEEWEQMKNEKNGDYYGDDDDYYDDGDDDFNVFSPNQISDAFLKKGEEANENAALAFNQIGTSYLYYDGDYEAAIEYFQQAIDSCPSYHPPYYHIVRAFKEKGEKEEEKRYKKLYKSKFGKEIEEVDFEQLMDEQERVRDEIINSLPNVSTVTIGGGNYDSDGHA